MIIYSNRLYVFDPLDESWVRLADMPVAVNTNGVIVDGIYILLAATMAQFIDINAILV